VKDPIGFAEVYIDLVDVAVFVDGGEGIACLVMKVR
jgi:hypothetical protein